jgi:hypothetical protein
MCPFPELEEATFRTFQSSDPHREQGRDCDPECVERGCDRQPEDERGGAEMGRRSVTSAGDRATAVTGIRRRTAGNVVAVLDAILPFMDANTAAMPPFWIGIKIRV